jgi:hypothetical protein
LADQKFHLYPNPTNGIFNVTLPSSIIKAEIEICNSTGALIYKRLATNALNTVDLTNQLPGLYFIKVISENRTIASQKIIKQ